MYQYPFKFNYSQLFDVEEFITSDCNIEAYNFICDDKFDFLTIYGEKSSGKTHLCKIWQKNNNAIFILPNKIMSILSNECNYENSCFIFDDFDEFFDEESLFHLINFIKQNNARILLTSSFNPNHLDYSLDDLKSRIKSFNNIGIHQPNDDCLRNLYLLRFARLQLNISDEVLDYLIKNTERSFKSLDSNVGKIDKLSIQKGGKITIRSIKDIIVF